MPAAWCLAIPMIGEREVAAELLAHAARMGTLRPGLIRIGTRVLPDGTSRTWSPPRSACT
jgi:hypothetical protein